MNLAFGIRHLALTTRLRFSTAWSPAVLHSHFACLVPWAIPMFRYCLIALVAWLSSPAAAAQTSQRPPAVETARALQDKYDRVRDFTAGFTHTYQGGILKKTLTETGTVEVKKPARMRWEYTQPEKKLFVSDGRKIYSYVPADKQVIVSSVPADDQATTGVLFLAGKGNITRDFDVSYAPGGSETTWALRLDPKSRQRDYDWLVVVVDRQSLQIRELTAAEKEGGTSTFRFTNLRENTGVPDTHFTFKIPRGVDVIDADSPGR
jgi:outer membrane lipoprotein carrier protein